MNDERNQEIESKLRAALGHLESRTPSPPPLPISAGVPSRRRWWAPSTVATAALITVLIAVPLFLWLGPDDTASQGTPTTSGRTPRQDTLPYLGLDLEGWELVIASEHEAQCPSDPDQPALGIGRNVSYSRRDLLDIPSVVLSMFIAHEDLASNPCTSVEFPRSFEELRPGADLPYVTDHGVITVMGHQAQIVEEYGSFVVTWLLGGIGSHARLIVFANDAGEAVLTVDEVRDIAAGIVEITEDQWVAMLAETSGITAPPPPGAGPTVTIPEELTAGGMIEFHPLGGNPVPDPVPVSYGMLAGGSVRIDTPAGFAASGVSREASFRSADGGLVHLTVVDRGSGLWAFGGDPGVSLIEVGMLDGSYLASYHLGGQDAVLFQRGLYDIFSYAFGSLAEAQAFFDGAQIVEAAEGVSITVPGWQITEGALTLTLVGDPERGLGEAILDVRPRSSEYASFEGEAIAGVGGEFILVGATTQEGFLFRSSTAWARLTPIGGSESVIRTLEDWYEQFNVAWATP